MEYFSGIGSVALIIVSIFALIVSMRRNYLRYKKNLDRMLKKQKEFIEDMETLQARSPEGSCSPLDEVREAFHKSQKKTDLF